MFSDDLRYLKTKDSEVQVASYILFILSQLPMDVGMSVLSTTRYLLDSSVSYEKVLENIANFIQDAKSGKSSYERAAKLGWEECFDLFVEKLTEDHTEIFNDNEFMEFVKQTKRRYN